MDYRKELEEKDKRIQELKGKIDRMRAYIPDGLKDFYSGY